MILMSCCDGQHLQPLQPAVAQPPCRASCCCDSHGISLLLQALGGRATCPLQTALWPELLLQAKGWACNVWAGDASAAWMGKRCMTSSSTCCTLHQRFTAAQALETPFLKRLAAEEVSPPLHAVVEHNLLRLWPAAREA